MDHKPALAFLFLIILGATFAVNSTAQQLRMKGYTAYAFDDNVESYYNEFNYYRGTLQGGVVWGVGAEYFIKKDYGIEVFYKRLDSNLPAIYASGTSAIQAANFDYSMNNIMLSSTRYLRISERLEPYLGIFAGASIFNIHNSENGKRSNTVKLGYGVRLGTNLWLSKRVAVNLGIEFTSASQAFGADLYVGSNGITPGLNSSSTMFQFALGGGLVFQL